MSAYSDNKKPSGGAILLICSTEVVGGDGGIENCSFYVLFCGFLHFPHPLPFLAAIFALFDVHVRIYCGKLFLLLFFFLLVSMCVIFLHILYETYLETTLRDPCTKIVELSAKNWLSTIRFLIFYSFYVSGLQPG